VVAGVPARRLHSRFSPAMVERLLKLAWWEFDLSALAERDYSDVERFASNLEQAIEAARVVRATFATLKVVAGKIVSYTPSGGMPRLEDDPSPMCNLPKTVNDCRADASREFPQLQLSLDTKKPITSHSYRAERDK